MFYYWNYCPDDDGILTSSRTHRPDMWSLDIPRTRHIVSLLLFATVIGHVVVLDDANSHNKNLPTSVTIEADQTVHHRDLCSPQNFSDLRRVLGDQLSNVSFWLVKWIKIRMDIPYIIINISWKNTSRIFAFVRDYRITTPSAVRGLLCQVHSGHT